MSRLISGTLITLLIIGFAWLVYYRSDTNKETASVDTPQLESKLITEDDVEYFPFACF